MLTSPGPAISPAVLDALHRALSSADRPDVAATWLDRLERDPAALAAAFHDLDADPERLRGFFDAFVADWVDRTIGPERASRVVSVGVRCLTAEMLRRAGMRRAAYPFDWIFSRLPMVSDCLADDFETFLDPRHHALVPGPERKARHTLYGDRYGIDHVFNHHAMDLRDRHHFRRAVDRFQALLADPRPSTFVAIAQDRPGYLEAGRRLADDLAARGPRNTLVQIGLVQDPNHPTPALARIHADPTLQAYHFRHASQGEAFGFADELDTLALIMGLVRVIQGLPD